MKNFTRADEWELEIYREEDRLKARLAMDNADGFALP